MAPAVQRRDREPVLGRYLLNGQQLGSSCGGVIGVLHHCLQSCTLLTCRGQTMLLVTSCPRESSGGAARVSGQRNLFGSTSPPTNPSGPGTPFDSRTQLRLTNSRRSTFDGKPTRRRSLLNFFSECRLALST